MFHTRCREIEELLRARCRDLEEEIARLHASIEETRSQHQSETRDLMDRFLAVANPSALHAVNRSTAPAVPMPKLTRPSDMKELNGFRRGVVPVARPGPPRMTAAMRDSILKSPTAAAAQKEVEEEPAEDTPETGS